MVASWRPEGVWGWVCQRMGPKVAARTCVRVEVLVIRCRGLACSRDWPHKDVGWETSWE